MTLPGDEFSHHPPARKLLAAGMAALILAAALLTFNLMMVALGGLLIIADPLEQAQVVVVLAGGRGDRMQEASRILSEKNAGQLIITNPESSAEADLVASQRQSASEAGVSAEILTTLPHGNSTYAEAVELRRFLEERGAHSALVVTDPFHSFRTRLIFREVFRGSSVDVNVRPVRGHWYRSTTWWTSRAGWEATLSEYAKLAAFLAGVRTD